MAPLPSQSEHQAAEALILLANSDIPTDEFRAPKLNVKWSSRRSRSKGLFMSKTGSKGIKKDEAILNLLSRRGCLPEVEIRKELGGNPDTSKALRKLLTLGKVKRVGAGGRRQPYVYTIS